MDLALELGMTVETLGRTMTERELSRWARYARVRRLPARRIEFYLAQIAFVVAKSIGGTNSKSLTDWLIEFAPPAVPAPTRRRLAKKKPAQGEFASAKELAFALNEMRSGPGVIVIGERRRAREAREREEANRNGPR